MEDDVSICRGTMAYRVPGIGSPDAPALDMLAAILGGGESSILAQALRMRRQLVHDIDVSCWNPGRQGLFWISYTCDVGTGEKVEAAIMEEIEAAINKGFKAEDLAKARRMALTGELDYRKTVSGMASRLGISEVVVGDLFYTTQYYAALDRLRPADITSAAARHLVPATQTRVTLDAEGHSRSAHCASRPDALPDFEARTLPNGARIVMQRDKRLPKVHIRYGALGGPLYEQPSKRGVTALMATLLTRDTQTHSAEQVSSIIESAGGRFDDFCGNNSFGLALETLSGDVQMGLDLLENGLLKPDFRADTFGIERAAQIADLRESDDEISDRGRKLLRRAFYGEHPYNTGSDGSIEALEKLTLADISAQYRKLVCAANSVISICGDFDPATAIPRIEAILDALPSTPFAVEEPAFTGPESQNLQVSMDREQAVIFQGFPGPGVRDADYHAAEALDEVLSDMSGPLFVSVRERKGLTYFVGASRMTGVNTGMFTLYGGTRPDQVALVRKEFEATLESIRAVGLPEEELCRARTRLKARRRLGMQTIGARANAVLLDVIYDLPILRRAEYDAMIDALTPADIREFALKYLRDEKRVDFVIGPSTEMPIVTEAPEDALPVMEAQTQRQ
jgi:zinc protease